MTTILSSHYTDLGKQFSRQNLPEKIKSPVSLLWNDELAEQLNVELDDESRAAYFSGSSLFPGSKPTSMAYSGHQFGHFNPQLGDGRAHLLGELIDRDGVIQELHTKGSGRTPFSRNGDGKCGIKPAVREFIMSEALYALGIPTTRSLSVVSTAEALMRQEQTTGAVVTRVAKSHIRVGTFEYFAARGMQTEINTLTNLCIKRHFDNIALDDPRKYIKLLSQVIDKQIYLVTEWMRIGFIHGVMNTDNTLLSGDTIDYGPCAMMGAYDPGTVFSSIDQNARYAYGNQPAIIQWNIARLAECLLPLIDKDEKKAIAMVMALIEQFSDKYYQSQQTMMANKLGFNDSKQVSESLVNNLLEAMAKNKLDYTVTFAGLSDSIDDINSANPHIIAWHKQWLSELKNNGITPELAKSIMKQSNPIVIPRNHQIEAVLKKTEETLNNSSAIHFLSVLKSPYSIIADTHIYQGVDAKSDLSYQTYCGT